MGSLFLFFLINDLHKSLNRFNFAKNNFEVIKYQIIMQEEFKSEGKCLFCGEKFAQADVVKHLTTHFKEMSKTGKPGLSFLVQVGLPKKWGKTPFFLSLWVDGETTLKTMDTFLRDIWLECCGHMSAFSLPRRKPSKKFDINAFSHLIDEDSEFPNDISMSKKAKVVFAKGLVLEYEYDFGSSTNLEITVVNEFPVKADKKIVLLSRNEPMEILCCICKKVPATQICTVCMYNKESVFCDQCAKKHEKKCEDFADYASMPIVNSPRMGVCGYTGGRIDTERDVYQA